MAAVVRAPAPDAAWEAFVEATWEKIPVVLPRFVSDPRVSEAVVFDALRAAAAERRRGHPTRFGLWRDDVIPQRGLLELLARPDETDLERYLDRVSAGGRTFYWNQFQIQRYSRPLWEFGRAFVRGLIAKVGLPGHQVDMDVLVGRYHTTPRGIHTDMASTFAIVVSGRKRILLWPRDFFSDRGVAVYGHGGLWELPDADIEAFARDAIVLEGGPGDVLYWPASYWHVGRDCGSLATVATLNIGLFFDPVPRVGVGDCALDLLSAVAARLSVPQLVCVDLRGGLRDDVVPAVERAALETLQSAAGMTALSAMVQAHWLRRITGLGFETVPPPPPRSPLPPGARLRPSPDFPLAWSHADGRWLVSAGGYVEHVPAEPGVPELLEHVANAEEVTIDALRSRFSPLGSLVPSLLEMLVRIGALELLESGAMDDGMMVAEEPGSSVVRWITNLDQPPFDLRVSLRGGPYHIAGAYLRRVRTGTGGGPYCPFADAIERNNGYRLRIIEEPLDGEALRTLVEQIPDRYAAVRRPGEPTDWLTVLVEILAHPACCTIDFASALERRLQESNIRNIECGLMVGTMMPLHAPGGRKTASEPKFVAPIPLLVTRSIHHSDRVFMSTPAELAAFSSILAQCDEGCTGSR